MFKKLVCVLVASVGLFLSTAVAAQLLTGWPLDNRDNLNPPRGVGVFMANGIFDPADLTFVPPTPDDFDEVIMGRDEQAKADRRGEAVAYFQERFGVDFSAGDVAQQGAIVLLRNYVDPRWNYRCYGLPDRRPVPPSGLIVHDASYNLAVIDVNGATLFGTWGGPDGTDVPVGTVAVDGEYLVQGTNEFKLGHPRNVYIHFQSVSPIFGALSGDIKFNCRLENADFGSGAALGRQEIYGLENGLQQIAINNVLQFPQPKWAAEQQ